MLSAGAHCSSNRAAACQHAAAAPTVRTWIQLQVSVLPSQTRHACPVRLNLHTWPNAVSNSCMHCMRCGALPDGMHELTHACATLHHCASTGSDMWMGAGTKAWSWSTPSTKTACRLPSAPQQSEHCSESCRYARLCTSQIGACNQSKHLSLHMVAAPCQQPDTTIGRYYKCASSPVPWLHHLCAAKRCSFARAQGVHA